MITCSKLRQNNNTRTLLVSLNIVYAQLRFTFFSNVWQLFRNHVRTKKSRNSWLLKKIMHACCVFVTFTNAWQPFRNCVRTKKKHDASGNFQNCSHNKCSLQLLSTLDNFFEIMPEQNNHETCASFKKGSYRTVFYNVY